MFIDIVFALLMVMAFLKGFQRGLIIAVFSLLAVIVGLAAAMKLSAVAATYIDDAIKISSRWVRVISFALVFFIVVLLIRWAANLIEKGAKFAMLGWVNRIGGFLFYAAMYTIILSVLLFYASQIKLMSSDTFEKSVTWAFIQPWGPKVINSLGEIIPFFKDMFQQLQHFFEGLSKKGDQMQAFIFFN